jgi:hypothetical protein
VSAKKKTSNLMRAMVPLDLLVDNDANPNQMSARAFDLLVDNMNQRGWTDPAYVAPVHLPTFLAARGTEASSMWPLLRKQGDNGRLRIVGGHHRVKAARFLQLAEGPCTIDLDPEFDKDVQEAQLVRHNIIRGEMDPQKFLALYERQRAKHGAEMMAEVFGFQSQAMLDKLIQQTAKSLPPELKQKFKDAAGEIKTVDDLSKILNRLFSTYGSTLPHGMMFLDYGGKESVWLRISKKTYDATHVVAGICSKEKRTVDDVVGRVLQLIANGEADKLLAKVVAETPAADVPDGFKGIPTAEMLEKVA